MLHKFRFPSFIMNGNFYTIIKNNNNNHFQSIRLMSIAKNVDQVSPSSSDTAFKIEHDVKQQKFRINFDPGACVPAQFVCLHLF